MPLTKWCSQLRGHENLEADDTVPGPARGLTLEDQEKVARARIKKSYDDSKNQAQLDRFSYMAPDIGTLAATNLKTE